MEKEQLAFLGLFVFMATMVANRFLGEKNFRALANEDKLKLVEAFSGYRSLSTYVPIGLMLVVLLIGRVMPQLFLPSFIAVIVFLIAFSIAIQVLIIRRLGALELPSEYVAKFRFQSILVQVGNLVGYALIVFGISERLG